MFAGSPSKGDDRRLLQGVAHRKWQLFATVGPGVLQSMLQPVRERIHSFKHAFLVPSNSPFIAISHKTWAQSRFAASSNQIEFP